MQFIFNITNENKSKYLAKILAQIIIKGDLILLYGKIGIGKSFIIRIIIQTLLNDYNIYIPSPTFSLLQSYNYKNFKIIHIDLYRIKKLQEIEELGFIQELENNITFIEWPEIGINFFTNPTLSIFLKNNAKSKLAMVKINKNISYRKSLNKILEKSSFYKNTNIF